MTRSISIFLRFSLLILLSSVCYAEQALTTIPEIRALMPDEVDGIIPAEVEGQILALPLFYGTFLYDGTDGIFMSYLQCPDMKAKLRVGDWIRVKGVVEPGGFSPAIVAHQIEIIDHQPLPDPMPYVPGDQNLAEMDCQWVSISGRLVSVSTAENRLDVTVGIEFGEKVYPVQVPYSKEGVDRLSDLMFREVKLNAVFGIRFNLKKQAVGRTFLVHSIEDIIPIDSAGQNADPIQVSITQLMRKETSSEGLLRTGGIVTGILGSELFLRGDAAGLRIQSAQPVTVVPGDYVEVIGYVWPQPISPAFRALEVNRLRSQSPPEPRQVRLGVSLDEALNYDLIQLQAQLVDVGKQFAGSGDEQQILLCRSGIHLFEARLPVGQSMDEGLSAGAELTVTGNAHLVLSPHTQGQLKMAGFWLQLRGIDDVLILRNAPWWTPKRLNWAFGGLAGALILILGWVFLLRQTVDRQTQQIGKQVEREAILNERQRIARELHDNLEQGLAGMAIQLKGCLRQQELSAEEQLRSVNDELLEEQIRKDAVKNKNAIGIVQDMLVHCSEESRSTILDLRAGLLERMDLPAALKEALEPLSLECGAELELLVEGLSQRLERPIERNLLLIAKEAVTNAARHAMPKKIAVQVNCSDDKVSLLVCDDGKGFDTASLTATERFGVQGMYERAHQVGGTLQIESTIGSGSSVEVAIPLKRGRL